MVQVYAGRRILLRHCPQQRAPGLESHPMFVAGPVGNLEREPLPPSEGTGGPRHRRLELDHLAGPPAAR